MSLLSNLDLGYMFQGIGTMFATEPKIAFARVFLIILGIILLYLGTTGVLEGLIMIPMGLGMSTVNAAVLFMEGGRLGNIIVDPNVSDPFALIDILQINFLQPIYSLTFSNALIACFVFMGIGVLSDISYLVAKPFSSMTLAICAELGTVLTFPIAVAMGLSFGQAAAVSLVGGADGPMVIYASLMLAKEYFVPITIVAYLYLSLCYAGYPYMVKLLIPKSLRGIKMDLSVFPDIKPGEKIAFAVAMCAILSLLFPSAAPLFLSFFLGVCLRESGISAYTELLEKVVLYSATLFLGLILGVLTEANTILDPVVFKILILGVTALFISGLGGIIGGYIMYFATGGKYNPVIGIAAVSCVPTCAKVAQKIAMDANKQAFILPYAMGGNVCGVITTAILTGAYISVVPLLQ